MDANSVLVNALNSYIYDISSDYKGDCTALLKQVETCRDYANNNEITVGWIKSHYMIILPAIKSYRKFLKFLIEDADRNKNFEGGRPSSIIIGDQVNPKTLGALLAHFENKVMFQGFVWNINSFDQEGVQLGKVLAKRVLAHETDGALKEFSDLLNI